MSQRPARPSPVRLVHSASEASDLIARCRALEPAALRLLFQSERSRVHRLLFHVVGSNGPMDDLLQDTFLQVFRSLPSFRGESSLQTWIDRCAVRVAYAYFGRRARQPVLEPVRELSSFGPSPEEGVEQRNAVRRLYAELDRLEPKQRMAFTLFVLEGRAAREVAEIMESTVATAKVRVWRARRALQRRALRDPLLSEFLSGDDEPSDDEEPRS
jgi:RNA polymerase sigma-70 factor, ECF subfamily